MSRSQSSSGESGEELASLLRRGQAETKEAVVREYEASKARGRSSAAVAVQVQVDGE